VKRQKYQRRGSLLLFNRRVLAYSRVQEPDRQEKPHSLRTPRGVLERASDKWSSVDRTPSHRGLRIPEGPARALPKDVPEHLECGSSSSSQYVQRNANSRRLLGILLRDSLRLRLGWFTSGGQLCRANWQNAEFPADIFGEMRALCSRAATARRSFVDELLPKTNSAHRSQKKKKKKKRRNEACITIMLLFNDICCVSVTQANGKVWCALMYSSKNAATVKIDTG